MLLLILSYIVMVERMSRFYRFRYFAILILLLAASLLDIMTTWSDSIYDMSMAAFGIMLYSYIILHTGMFLMSLLRIHFHL